MKRFFLSFFALTVLGVGLSAADISSDSLKCRQEIRLGIGDMMFETLVWNNQIHKQYASASAYLFPEKRDYWYLPHISGEYSYHILPWLSVGAVLDFQMTGWNTYVYDGRNELVECRKENFTNLCIMPLARFNYFRREHVGLYSAITVGIDFNGGTEVDGFGHHTRAGLATDLRLIGVTAGNGHWWGFAELGGIFAMRNPRNLFLVGSELVKCGVSYKF